MIRIPIVILDTSSLLITYEGIDVFTGIEEVLGSRCFFIVPYTVIEELFKLSLRVGRRSKAANLVLKLLRGRVFIYGHRKFRLADEEIVSISTYFRDEAYVVTIDDELKKKLKKLGIKVITWWFSKEKFVVI